jgi:hypothetical protein
MKVCDHYDHLRGLQNVIHKGAIFNELKSILNDELILGKSSSKIIKKTIREKFNDSGWADNVRVGNSKLTISFLKTKVGVCFQIGNVARTYADILKLSQLFKTGVIDVGVIIVPDKLESKLMGANYAKFDRLASELKHFKDIVPIPLLVLSLSN